MDGITDSVRSGPLKQPTALLKGFVTALCAVRCDAVALRPLNASREVPYLAMNSRRGRQEGNSGAAVPANVVCHPPACRHDTGGRTVWVQPGQLHEQRPQIWGWVSSAACVQKIVFL